MTNLYLWLVAAVGPLVIRAIVAIGFTAVTFIGVTELVNTLVQDAQTTWSGMPVAVLQVCTITGIPTCLGMIFAAYTSRVALWVSISGTKFVLSKP